MSTSNTALIMGEFADRFGLPPLGFEDDLGCTLSFDGLIVHLELTEDRSLLCCHLLVDRIEEARRTEIALEIADANFLLARTQGGSFGMDGQSGNLVLTMRMPDATLSLSVFEETLENLVNLAHVWQKVLAGGPVPVSGMNDDFSFLLAGDSRFSMRV